MKVLKQTPGRLVTGDDDIRFFLKQRLRLWPREMRSYPALRFDIRHRLRMVLRSQHIMRPKLRLLRRMVATR